ncbi:MAG: ABC transporter ATP-binding protein [Lachnospiraceae bacterium]|nr:ABC transporter ATP-binding protein [Lachnospiraceae bacterium]
MKITISDIRKRYRSSQILNGVVMEAEEGSMTCILGKNGCGKSTLLSILAGVVRADSGAFLYQQATESPIDLFRRRQDASRLIGYVPQSTPLLEELSALDNLRLWYTGGNKVLRQELEEGVLKDLDIDSFLHKNVRTLSGGMKKRLSIGCALAHHPRILLLDEPGAALDLIAKEQIVTWLRKFCSRGGIVLLASHELGEIENCSRAYVLKNGVAEALDHKVDGAALASLL